ncbi:hypothetical protein [Streptomyces sp. NPDC126522]|uniref:hypothetical protein n=1 Tax=Streptomyces sp. NPDC126522 TaxID=3155211 RepID=UPI003325B90C
MLSNGLAGPEAGSPRAPTQLADGVADEHAPLAEVAKAIIQPPAGQFAHQLARRLQGRGGAGTDSRLVTACC